MEARVKIIAEEIKMLDMNHLSSAKEQDNNKRNLENMKKRQEDFKNKLNDLNINESEIV